MSLPVSDRDIQPLLLGPLLDRGAILQPENLIATKKSNGTFSQRTYREHQLAAQQLASALQKWGIQRGDRVATLMWNSAQHLQCYHAISCMGAILHTINLRLPPKDLGLIIEHAHDRIIIADADLLEPLSKVTPGILANVEQFVCCGLDWEPNRYTIPATMPSAKCTSFEAFVAAGDSSFRWPRDLPETAVHGLCYTSGTTGMPKGAAVSHRSTYLHTLCCCGTDQLGVSGADVLLPFVPMFHVFAWGNPFMALMLGTRLVFNGKQMEADSLLDTLLEWQVTFSNGVPTVWQGVQAVIERRGVESIRQRSKLRKLLCGGSSPPAAMMKWYWDNLGIEFIQAWGMTETSPVASVGKRISRHRDLSMSDKELNENSSKPGLVVPCLESKVVDPDDLDKEMPPGTPGEVLLRGPWVITEYFQYDTPDKFHKGWLVTGDVAKIDEMGAIVLTDRSKDVIKSGGEWISSIDLENHIAALKEVSIAAVVSMPHPRWDERPVAVVCLAEGSTPTGLEEKVKEHCLKNFAKFQLPDDLVVWKEIPLTGTGKIDKKKIRQLLNDKGYVLPTAKESSKL